MILIDVNYVFCECYVIGVFFVIVWYNYYLEIFLVCIVDLKFGLRIKCISFGYFLGWVFYFLEEWM